MRSIKELLQVMLDNQDYINSGLCSQAGNLCFKRKITYEEYSCLKNYIKDNRPSKWSSLDAFIHRNCNFYWHPTNTNSRIKWIKKHIKLNS
jgi:hypothetical protein